MSGFCSAAGGRGWAAICGWKCAISASAAGTSALRFCEPYCRWNSSSEPIRPSCWRVASGDHGCMPSTFGSYTPRQKDAPTINVISAANNTTEAAPRQRFGYLRQTGGSKRNQTTSNPITTIAATISRAMCGR